MPLHWATH